MWHNHYRSMIGQYHHHLAILDLKFAAHHTHSNSFSYWTIYANLRIFFCSTFKPRSCHVNTEVMFSSLSCLLQRPIVLLLFVPHLWQTATYQGSKNTTPLMSFIVVAVLVFSIYDFTTVSCNVTITTSYVDGYNLLKNRGHLIPKVSCAGAMQRISGNSTYWKPL